MHAHDDSVTLVIYIKNTIIIQKSLYKSRNREQKTQYSPWKVRITANVLKIHQIQYFFYICTKKSLNELNNLVHGINSFKIYSSEIMS